MQPLHPEEYAEEAVGFPEPRTLVTEWPSIVRVGDSAPIRMFIRLAEPGIPGSAIDQKTDQVPADVITGQNPAEAYQTVAQARLELDKMEYRPTGVISEALLPGKSARFSWSVRSFDGGFYPGTIWLHVQFIPRNGGEELRKVISAQTFEIRADRFLGLSGNSARILGAIGLVLGAMVGFDIFSLTPRLFSEKTNPAAPLN
ncbi:MAG: hypothetical protein A2Z16_05655 [Chloroflexi bacterium RBG_16_54_18]|nr:MAG: hypothetical protein A2Z16_05655 [Chloroflexi bacterium RBG_16_54_18]